MERFRFELRHSWDGGPLQQGEFARIDLRIGSRGGSSIGSSIGSSTEESIEVEIEATDYGDPAPPAPPGRCDGLWNYEVVELFLLGRGDRYLELELGPHGHFLALSLAGRRQLVASDLPVEFEAERRGALWHGRARIALEHLPPDLHAANAYAIHGQGAARRHLAWEPVPGPAPDFHRLTYFPALPRVR